MNPYRTYNTADTQSGTNSSTKHCPCTAISRLRVSANRDAILSFFRMARQNVSRGLVRAVTGSSYNDDVVGWAFNNHSSASGTRSTWTANIRGSNQRSQCMSTHVCTETVDEGVKQRGATKCAKARRERSLHVRCHVGDASAPNMGWAASQENENNLG
jgi:hypothetical protein